MTRENSFQSTVLPSAVLADPPAFFVPLFAVTAMSLAQTYFLPPLGVSKQRMVLPAHDDTITLSALLIGPERFMLKQSLEIMADISKRGGALESLTRGFVGGLVLVTSMTIRTDMQIQSLSFTASAARRDVLDVAMTLVHVPRPGALSRVLDLASVQVAALADFA
jgi:hypothetical protein